MSALAEISQGVEANLLGALMHDNAALERVEFLRPDMFTGRHGEIFEAMQRHASENKPFDAVSLSETYGNLEQLARMQMGTLSVANIDHQARLVQDAHRRRQVIASASEVIALANSRIPTGELVDRAQEAMMLLHPQTGREAAAIRDVLSECVEALERRFEHPGDLIGLPTGFIDLDQRFHGLRGGHLYILAARPSMGKTTLALNIADAASQQAPVAIFSLEMPRQELVDKLICAIGRVDYERYQTGNMHDDDWPHITHAVSELQTRRIVIDDNASLSISQLRSRARKLHRKHSLGLIVIDYLQLMSAAADRESRRLGIEEISRGLKSLAKELDVPVLALAQLSRDCEKRPNKRPIMSDLRESGSIEQDADVVAFIYRDEVYNVDSQDTGTAEILTRKNRTGTIGTNRLCFLGHQSRFENFASRDRWSGPQEYA